MKLKHKNLIYSFWLTAFAGFIFCKKLKVAGKKKKKSGKAEKKARHVSVSATTLVSAFSIINISFQLGVFGFRNQNSKDSAFGFRHSVDFAALIFCHF